jgi:hypothetical protein
MNAEGCETFNLLGLHCSCDETTGDHRNEQMQEVAKKDPSILITWLLLWVGIPIVPFIQAGQILCPSTEPYGWIIAHCVSFCLYCANSPARCRSILESAKKTLDSHGQQTCRPCLLGLPAGAPLRKRRSQGTASFPGNGSRFRPISYLFCGPHPLHPRRSGTGHRLARKSRRVSPRYPDYSRLHTFFTPLRPHPRFRALLKKLGLPH